MPYIFTPYNIPLLSLTQRFGSNGTVYTSWQSFGPVAAPTVTPWFCLPVGLSLEGSFDADGFAVTLVPTIQFGRDNGSVAFGVNVGYCGSSVVDNGYATACFSGALTFTGTLTKIRLAVACTKGNASYADTYTSTAAGVLRVYESAPGGVALPIAASSMANKPAVVTAGKAGKQITRIRYRVDQAAMGAGAWASLPRGGRLIRFPEGED